MTSQQRIRFGEFIRHLVLAAGSMALYSREHRTTVDRTSSALACLNEALVDDTSVTAIFLGNEMFVNGTPLEKDPQLERFIRAARGYGIGHIVIERGATYDEIGILLKLVSRQADRELPSTPHLRFGSVEVEQRTVEPDEGHEAIPTYSAIPTHLLKRLDNAFSISGPRDPFDLDAVMSLVAGFVTSFRSEANPLLALVSLREMDEYTFTHSLDVCILNLAQGMSLGFEGQLLHDVGIAAMLHDVGKLLVPKHILDKPGNLEEDEWEFMRQHTVRGAEYLLNIPGVPRVAVMAAFEHHMKFDLSGYPKAPPGWQTCLCSQMTMISDCFDAIRTKRVYQDAMDFAKAAGIMLNLAGTGLNRALTLNFLKILEKMGAKWTPGSLAPHPSPSVTVS